MYFPFQGYGGNPNALQANYNLDTIPYLFQGQHLPPTSVVSGSGARDKNLKVKLENKEMWEKFSEVGNEMIVTRSGRLMFPRVEIKIEGLRPEATYMILLDIVPADSNRYRFFNSKWSVSGEAEPTMTGHKVIVHSSSPSLGSYWMSKSISFKDAKITNNATDKSSNIVLNSMQKYIPRIHIAEASDLIQLRTAHKSTFTFANTSFIAVTAYQNRKITRLKIENNAFAKGFREDCKRPTANKPSDNTSDDDEDDDKESTASNHSTEKQDYTVNSNNNNNINNSNNNFGIHFDDYQQETDHKTFIPQGMVDKTSTPLQNRIPADLNFDTPFQDLSFDYNQPPAITSLTPLPYRSFDDSGYSSTANLTSPHQDFQVHPAQYSHMTSGSSYSVTSPTTSDYSPSPTTGYYNNFFALGDSHGSTPPSFVQRHLDKRRRRQLQQPYQLPSQNFYNP